ncbi:cytochrome c biogenesis thiol:disulfide interchange protein DsbE [Neokomagataea thailandica NBRC 106555]|uniref:DsbE family thiol:disulfide interchange protein n=2 Tax=Neokomagataea TaxID=1223423 RepID=A0A4Y6V7N6_9PROT|nr:MULTISPECIES: DsbE family thiol:disulfide interchange protein [Neokomagataea]QDH24345.1 DsbE family thiol:disulfide interchange protein [Neokomagataea tanensis]GBR53220.1 cytochrome c biogenesis thiol:disulfide interchange protein DsbE [Neokomagataea thailandica NBRC 106555]
MNSARRKLLTALPIVGASALGIGFWRMLHGMENGGFDPRAVNTPQLGRAIPSFALPGLPGIGDGFSSTDLRDQHTPILLNFFASWCIPCVSEMPGLRNISQSIPIWGIAYKDHLDDAAAFIQRDGSPYARVAADQTGRTAIDWGVTGVPETFLVAPGGRILWHNASGLTPDIFDADIRPLLAAIQ